MRGLASWATLLLLAGCAAIAGCTATGAVEQRSPQLQTRSDEPKPPLFRGTLHGQRPALVLHRCDGGLPLFVIDETQGDLDAAFDALLSVSEDPPYVELDGSIEAAPSSGPGSAYREAIRVVEVDYLGLSKQVLGCSERLGGLVGKASGREPSWILTLATSKVVFEVVGETRAEFPFLQAEEDIGGWIYSLTDSTSTETLRVQVSFSPCTGSYREVWSQWTVDVTYRNKTYRGCGRPGW
jgi:uncharacterized membrane protein